MPRTSYRLRYSNPQRTVYVGIEREPREPALQRLTRDIDRLSAFLCGRQGLALLRFELEPPLSRDFRRFISDLSQRLEVPVVVAIAPLAPAEQAALAHELAAANNPAVRIEERPAWGPPRPFAWGGLPPASH